MPASDLKNLRENSIQLDGFRLSPRDDILVGSTEDGRLGLWALDAPQATPFTLPEDASPSEPLAVSPDGTRLIAAPSRGPLQEWELSGRSARVRGVFGPQTYRISGPAFMPADGKSFYSTSQNSNKVTDWDLTGASPRLRTTFEVGLQDARLRISPDGSTLVVFPCFGNNGSIELLESWR